MNLLIVSALDKIWVLISYRRWSNIYTSMYNYNTRPYMCVQLRAHRLQVSECLKFRASGSRAWTWGTGTGTVRDPGEDKALDATRWCSRRDGTKENWQEWKHVHVLAVASAQIKKTIIFKTSPHLSDAHRCCLFSGSRSIFVGVWPHCAASTTLQKYTSWGYADASWRSASRTVRCALDRSSFPGERARLPVFTYTCTGRRLAQTFPAITRRYCLPESICGSKDVWMSSWKLGILGTLTGHWEKSGWKAKPIPQRLRYM